MKIFLASDHAGYDLKSELIGFLTEQGHDVHDCGPFEFNKEDDYPDYIAEVATNVSQDPDRTWGIVIGGSGQGEAIMANRFPNVRAVVYSGDSPRVDGEKGPDKITATREHNNANVLSLGAWFLTPTEAKDAVARWLSTPFAGEDRHVRRLRKIELLSPHGGADSVSAGL